MEWIKRLLGIDKIKGSIDELNSQMLLHKRFVTDSIDDLKEYTRVDADIGIRGNNTIILTGVYRKKAYIRFYDVGDGEFLAMVDLLRELHHHALIRNIDAPPSFKGSFNLDELTY